MKLTSERLEQIKEGAGPSAQECAAMVAEIQASREHIPTTEGQGGGEELATRLRRARLNGLFDPSLALQLPDDNEQVDQLLDAIEDRLLSSPRVEEVRREAIEIALAESMKGPLSQDHPWDRGYRAGAAAVWSKLRALSLSTGWIGPLAMFTLFVTMTTIWWSSYYTPQTESFVKTYSTMIECRAAAAAYRALEFDGPRGQRRIVAECVG